MTPSDSRNERRDADDAGTAGGAPMPYASRIAGPQSSIRVTSRTSMLVQSTEHEASTTGSVSIMKPGAKPVQSAWRPARRAFASSAAAAAPPTAVAGCARPENVITSLPASSAAAIAAATSTESPVPV